MNGLYECNHCDNLWIIQLPQGWISDMVCPSCKTTDITCTALERSTT